MIQFTSHLKSEVDAKIELIESSEISMITKSLEASRVLRKAYNQLKEFILSYDFQGEEEVLRSSQSCLLLYIFQKGNDYCSTFFIAFLTSI